MPHADLPRYRDGFFQTFLAELPGSPTREALEQQQPAGTPFVLMGEYVKHTGAAFTAAPTNASIAPKYAIRTEVSGKPQTFGLVWIVERIDVATDSKATMVRILADFRKPSASDETKELSTKLAETWAKGLASDAVKTALAKNLTEITQVPEGLPTTNLEELKSFLLHFGTYKPNGEYYAKGAVAEGKFPEGVSIAYLAETTGNVAEVQLQRDHFYCSALVLERLWNPQAETGDYRQLVYRIEDQGETSANRWRLALLHTVAVKRTASDVFNRFVFFYAPVGLGLDIPESARTAIAPVTASFLERLPSHMAGLSAALDDPNTPLVGTQDAPYVLLLGAVTPDFPQTPLPEGVIADGEGAIRTFRCPPAHVMTLGARPDIQDLTVSTPVWIDMTEAKREVNLSARTLPAGITAANTGQGVLVGIVDSGIDGAHPAFLGRVDDPTKSRIHSVWNMWEKGGDSPFKRSGGKAAYNAMRFGKEYIGHAEVITVTDPGAHGTHVAGIAAGQPVGTWPGGISPAATIVVASVYTMGGFLNDIVAGIKYCFQKATELGLPCVVNISMGTERHPHDSTDPLSISVTQLVSQSFIPAVGIDFVVTPMPGYINGRVICASAGNARGTNLHWQATIPANGQVSVVYRPSLQPASTGSGSTPAFADDGITFWAYNEDASTVRLRISARDSANALLATPEVGLRGSGGAVTTTLPGGLQVNIHNGPERPNNRHYNPEIYWYLTPPAAAAFSPWIVKIRNTANSACVIHGFAAYREYRGSFVFNAAQTQPLIGVTYTPAELASFETHKVSTPGTAAGAICVAAFTSRPAGWGTTVGELAPFSSPGPLRAAGPGRRAIDVTAPGDAISSAKAGSTTVVDMAGTSMATPVVTGLVAALLQMDPKLNTGQIVNRLELACKRRPADSVDDWGLGRIDAALFLKT
jgi:subtilisin family serine protease